MSIKVGTRLYYKPGYRSVEPWVDKKIMGETAQSWLVGEGIHREKVNKKTMLTAADRQGMKTRWYTKQQIADKDFCDTWARDIAASVGVCNDPVKLRQIAAIVGKVLD